MPTTTVKPVSQVVEKWARRVAGASQDYEMAAAAAGDVWQRNATAGAGNYQAGVTQAAAQGRYAKGISRVTSSKFVRGVREKGAARFGAGAAAGQPDFQAGIAPVLEVIGRVDFPPRGARGAESNLARVRAVATALRNFATSR
jgi:hypothetical protein